ncbi:MAG: aminodeoxychorismate lyase [Thiotrichales bacterium]|nr:MAG: aminodeoxychorismate lyase [Thiotrichales bacterium]
MNRLLINGISAEYVSAMDRGLHYGDGIFETIACIDARPVFIEQHLDRMQRGADKLDIPFPDRQLVLDDIHRLLTSANGDSIIKLMLTRGRGERGYRFTGKPIATRICLHSARPDHVADWQQHGITAQFCETRVSRNASLSGIKSLNRLENVLAANELADTVDEGFMLDDDGNVVEGTMTNFFAVIDDTLVTPDLSYCGIHGIVREQIIQQAAKNNIPVHIRRISREQLAGAREIFICNSVIGVCPVRQLEQQRYGEDRITTTIKTILQRRIEADAKAAA